MAIRTVRFGAALAGTASARNAVLQDLPELTNVLFRIRKAQIVPPVFGDM